SPFHYLLTSLHHPTRPLFPYTTLFRFTARAVRSHPLPARRATAAGVGPAPGAYSGDVHPAPPREGSGAGRGNRGRPPLRRSRRRSEEHTSELQSRFDLVCRLVLEKKNW